MEVVKITVKNGKATPKNPFDRNADLEYNEMWKDFESTVQWHDLWDTKFNFRTDFSGDIEAELVWVMYDDNDGYQEWNLSTHPYRDKNGGYLTKQVYMADIPVLKVEKEEAKTVEGIAIELIGCLKEMLIVFDRGLPQESNGFIVCSKAK